MLKKTMLTLLMAATGFSVAAETNQTKEATTMNNAITEAQTYIQTQIDSGKINKSNSNWRIRLPKFPALTYKQGESYFWDLETNKGKITLKFLPDVAPNHVSNFIYLSELGYFDGLIFHRVIQGFMAQGGCPIGKGSGSPGYEFNGEFDPNVKHDRPGLLSMANRGPGTDGSQFFITFVPTPWLDGKHTIFGEVTEGMDVVKALEAAGSRSGSTTEPLTIDKAQVRMTTGE